MVSDECSLLGIQAKPSLLRQVLDFISHFHFLNSVERCIYLRVDVWNEIEGPTIDDGSDLSYRDLYRSPPLWGVLKR